MDINKRNLEQLQTLKIKHSLDEFPTEANYLYIDGYKTIFISKSKNKFYHVCCSSACHFESVQEQTVYKVIYNTDDIEDAVNV